jgi:TetR/AcrR family transcriptional regulator
MSFEKDFEHRQELFDYSLEEFSTLGYEQASINAILEKAGMSKGQFYYHFKSKEDLYLALIDEVISRKKAFMAQVMRPQDFDQDIFTIFKIQMKHGMAFARAHPHISNFSESFLREKGSAIYQKALSIHNFENNAQVIALVEKALQRGELRSDLPPQFIHSLIGYLFTHSADLAGLCQVEDFEHGMNYVIDFLKNGLAKGSEPIVRQAEMKD